MQIDIKGHSGCSIDIVDDEDRLYVKKTSFDEKYFDRLHKQGEKQQNDISADHSGIKVPKIYENKISSHEAYILMDYVYAKNFVDYFENASAEDISNFIKKFINYINDEFEQCKIDTVSKTTFIKKFESVVDNCMKNPILTNSLFKDDVIAMLNKARTAFIMLPQELKLHVGKCHGDLTFSNILFTSNKMYFIDYLDSFIETPIQDIVKLRQDTHYLWSLQMYDKKYDPIRIKMIFDYIDEKIDEYFKSLNKEYENYYFSFQLMNILRILPYVKEEKVAEFLMKHLNSMVASFPESTLENLTMD